MDPFESIVFDTLEKSIQRVRRKAFRDSQSFESAVTSNLLKFGGLRQRDPRIRISSAVDGSYDLFFSQPHLSLSINDLLKEDNPDTNFLFEEDLANFEPDEDLIYKSKIPLWVICPLEQGKRVSIKRAW